MILFLFACQASYGLDYYTFNYKIEPGDSFGLILKKFVKDESIIHAKTPLVKKTMNNNPKVKDWYNLQPGSVLNLFISADFMDLEKYKPYESIVIKKVEAIKEEKMVSTYPSGIKASLFYMNSSGTFSQTTPDTISINFKQNSPLTLGLSATFYPYGKPYSTSFSTYYSYLKAPSNSLNDETINVPPEIGFNFYEEYRWQKRNITFYAGPDFEKFSLFNLAGLQNDGKIYIDGVSVFYLTVGAAKSFTLFKKSFFSKLSISKSIFSSYQNNAPESSDNLLSTKSYTGFRYLFYLNYKVNNKLYLHSLLKYHTMSGPSNLTTLRIGFGIGYILF